MITDAQFTAWLKDQTAIRTVLVEATIGLKAGGTTTRYLSSKAFVSGPTDTPANQHYTARIKSGITFTRALNIDGTVSLTWGDITLTNIDGRYDSWLDDYWSNRPINIYVGDASWARSDFRLAFGAVATGIDSSDRTTLVIHITDRLQRLNTPVTQTVLGGSTALYNSLLPLTFGEAFNVTPLLVDPTINKYMVHNGQIESIIEVRDNGLPVAFTPTLSAGTFVLNQAAFGTITCSVQGAQIPANFLLSTDHLDDVTIFNRTTGDSVLSAPIAGPYSGAPSTGLVPSTANTMHSLVSNALTVTPGTAYSASLMVKQGVGSIVEFYVASQISGAAVKIILNFSTLVPTLIKNNQFLADGGSVESWGYAPGLNGWGRLWITGWVDTTSTQMTFGVRSSDASGNTTYVGDNVHVALYTAGAQYEQGHYPTSYWNGSQPLGAPVYRNTIADNIRYLVTTYGDSVQKFANTDLNITSFVQFGMTHRQAIGLYLDSRQNVVDIATQMADAVGARMTIDSAGLAALVQLQLPQATTGTQVGPKDMVEKTLTLVNVTPVVAGVTIGYCRNYSVQSTLAGGLVPSSVALLGNEWLTVNRTDSTAAANYNLFTVPNEKDTLLVVGLDAANEATRRLNIFNVQRKLLQYSGYYNLLFENLGAPQTITNPRFGCSTGVTGQILSIAVDFTSPHIIFQVLI